MKLFTCTVMLRGELYQQVPNKIVTAGEILLLQTIHGKTSVFAVSPVPAKAPRKDGDDGAKNAVVTGPGLDFLGAREQQMLKNGSGEERERLRLEYGKEPESKKPWADIVWPGSIVKMPNSLAEIGMDAASQASALEEQAQKMLDEAKRLKAEAAEAPMEKVA